MTLPKKGRRSIHVDGDDFHWVVQFDRSGHVIIQHASGRGSCVVIEPLDIMQPSHVAAALRFAIASGWSPGDSGANVWLGFQLREPQLTRIPANSQIAFDRDLKRWVLPDPIDAEV